MSTQTSNIDQHAYVHQNIVVLKNSELSNDTAWSQIVKSVYPEFIPDTKYELNRTIVTKDMSLYSLTIWLNLACILPIKIRHKSSSKMIDEIQNIVEYLLVSIRRINSERLINEASFKIFLYLSSDLDISGFQKKHSNVVESVFGNKVEKRNVEYVQNIKVNNLLQVVKEESPNFFYGPKDQLSETKDTFLRIFSNNSNVQTPSSSPFQITPSTSSSSSSQNFFNQPQSQSQTQPYNNHILNTAQNFSNIFSNQSQPAQSSSMTHSQPPLGITFGLQNPSVYNYSSGNQQTSQQGWNNPFDFSGNTGKLIHSQSHEQVNTNNYPANPQSFNIFGNRTQQSQQTQTNPNPWDLPQPFQYNRTPSYIS